MGANREDSRILNPRRQGRRVAPVVPLPLAAAVWPAGLDGLEAKHGGRWLIKDTMNGYKAQRWVDNGGADEPVMPEFEVWHATAQGLDAALTALGDLR